MAPIPITLITGFLGSGKTTLLLNLIPQLTSQNPNYKLALLKNEFGDLAIDSQLATSSSISGVREMLNGCICCNLVGQLGPALEELLEATPTLNRVVVETSGSAFPATLAMEVNRLARESGGKWALDGVVTVIDVENWKGYEDTSYTAKLQARYTDLIVFNKWEGCGERRFDECLDRLGDMEGVDIAWVKSDKGRVPADIVFGVDGGLARQLGESLQNGHGHAHDHSHEKDHQSEVEVLSISLAGTESSHAVDGQKILQLLKTAPKDEVYRIKAVLTSSTLIPGSDAEIKTEQSPSNSIRYILNWAFGRWTCTTMDSPEHESSDGEVLRMTMILARYESKKWTKKIETLGFVQLDDGSSNSLSVRKIA